MTTRVSAEAAARRDAYRQQGRFGVQPASDAGIVVGHSGLVPLIDMDALLAESEVADAPDTFEQLMLNELSPHLLPGLRPVQFSQSGTDGDDDDPVPGLTTTLWVRAVSDGREVTYNVRAESKVRPFLTEDGQSRPVSRDMMKAHSPAEAGAWFYGEPYDGHPDWEEYLDDPDRYSVRRRDAIRARGGVVSADDQEHWEEWCRRCDDLDGFRSRLSFRVEMTTTARPATGTDRMILSSMSARCSTEAEAFRSAEALNLAGLVAADPREWDAARSYLPEGLQPPF